MTAEQRLRIDPEKVEWREVEGEVVALDVGRSEYIAVNASGAILWSALVEGSTRDELVQALVAEFEVDEERAAADVDAFLESLSERGILAR